MREMQAKQLAEKQEPTDNKPRASIADTLTKLVLQLEALGVCSIETALKRKPTVLKALYKEVAIKEVESARLAAIGVLGAIGTAFGGDFADFNKLYENLLKEINAQRT